MELDKLRLLQASAVLEAKDTLGYMPKRFRTKPIKSLQPWEKVRWAERKPKYQHKYQLRKERHCWRNNVDNKISG